MKQRRSGTAELFCAPWGRAQKSVNKAWEQARGGRLADADGGRRSDANRQRWEVGGKFYNPHYVKFASESGGKQYPEQLSIL